jgi:hypothetical protein
VPIHVSALVGHLQAEYIIILPYIQDMYGADITNTAWVCWLPTGQEQWKVPLSAVHTKTNSTRNRIWYATELVWVVVWLWTTSVACLPRDWVVFTSALYASWLGHSATFTGYITRNRKKTVWVNNAPTHRPMSKLRIWHINTGLWPHVTSAVGAGTNSGSVNNYSKATERSARNRTRPNYLIPSSCRQAVQRLWMADIFARSNAFGRGRRRIQVGSLGATLRAFMSWLRYRWRDPNSPAVFAWLCSDNLAFSASQKKKLRGLSPRANYTDRATAACRQNDCQLLRIEGGTWLVWRIPTAVFSVF